MRRVFGKIKPAAALTIAILGASCRAEAGLKLEIIDTSTNQVLFTQSNTASGGTIGTPGTIMGTDSNGIDYSINVSGSSNSPGGLNKFGKPTNNYGQIALSAVAVSTDGAINLTIELTDNNFVTPAPTPGSYLQSVIRTGTPDPAGVSFSSQSFADPNNGNNLLAPGQAPNATSATTTGLQGPYTTAVQNTATSSFSYGPGPFSLLNEVTLSFGPGDSNSVNLTTTATVFAPEPATMAMVLAGLPVAALFLTRRGKAATRP